jgi:hypothetical protein
VSNKTSQHVKSFPSWDLVIEESVRQLRDCESRASQLRVCMEYFSQRKASGDPFPGIEALRKKGLIPAEDSPTHN